MKHSIKVKPEQRSKPSEQTCILAVDVSQDSLNFYTENQNNCIELACQNKTDEIEEALTTLRKKTLNGKINSHLVVVEATGVYHENLLLTALRMGFKTALVNPEASSKMRVIESNDNNKTDVNDPHAIYRLAELGKSLRHRILKEQYVLLRNWHQIYDAAERGVVEAKCSIHNQLKRLFLDFGFTKDFLYSPSGKALMACFGCNPFLIVAAGKELFTQKMKASVPGIRSKSIVLLFQQAELSVKTRKCIEASIIAIHLRHLWEDKDRYTERKQEAKKQMEALYTCLQEQDKRLPLAEKGIISTFHLARIIAETGPLDDFSKVSKLVRYAGLNLRERQSGKYRGRTKLSKKGRVLLRKAIGQIVFPLVKKTGLYGEYYHSKIDKKMQATKAMTAVMRKFLKMFYGWYRSGKAFDIERVFNCESQFQQS